MDYYSAIKKKEILSFATIWMELEQILPSEINQIKTNTIWFHVYVESKKAKLQETKSTVMVTRDWKVGELRRHGSKGKSAVRRWIRPGKLMYYSSDYAAAAKSLQSCPTLCDPSDGSPPGSPVPGILQARTLEWVAISFSNAGKWKWKWSRSVVSDS